MSNITENTKNKVSLDVTGANSNPCKGLQNILDDFKKGEDTRPLIIRLVGQITDMTYMLKGDIVNKKILEIVPIRNLLSSIHRCIIFALYNDAVS